VNAIYISYLVVTVVQTDTGSLCTLFIGVVCPLCSQVNLSMLLSLKEEKFLTPPACPVVGAIYKDVVTSSVYLHYYVEASQFCFC